MPQHSSFTMRESFPRAHFGPAVQQGAHKEGTGWLLPLTSDLLNLLSPHPEGQISPQGLGVTRSLFRQHRRGERLAWDHP